MTLYNTYIVPVLMYGAEVWPLTQSDKKILKTFERKTLRVIYDPVNINRKWRTCFSSFNKKGEQSEANMSWTCIWPK